LYFNGKEDIPFIKKLSKDVGLEKIVLENMNKKYIQNFMTNSLKIQIL
jgi:hypothetical protein